VTAEIRQMVTFAPQSLILDPPFTKLDILSCRNLLIYLAPEMQKKLHSGFDYSLVVERRFICSQCGKLSALRQTTPLTRLSIFRGSPLLHFRRKIVSRLRQLKISQLVKGGSKMRLCGRKVTSGRISAVSGQPVIFLGEEPADVFRAKHPHSIFRINALGAPCQSRPCPDRSQNLERDFFSGLSLSITS